MPTDPVAARTWVPTPASDGETPADRFLRLACVPFDSEADSNSGADHDPTAAQALLVRHPELPAGSAAVAAVVGDTDELQRVLDRDPAAAGRPGGPHGWSPLMYLAYSRVPVEQARAEGAVQALLRSGADPDDGRFFRGLVPPFTVLTGLFGAGEQGEPAHRHAGPLARLLLAAGADPNDGQTLYNRQFDPADDAFELLLDAGLGRGDGGPWRRLVPDLLPPPGVLVRRLLDWAVAHDQRSRVALLTAHGVDIAGPLPSGATPVEHALRTGHPELAAQLIAAGAPEPALGPVDRFVAAALAGDAEAVRGTPPEVVAAARAARPGLVVWAAGLRRAAAVELLVAAGFDVNALGRMDTPVEQRWESPLHAAVERDDVPLARRLLELGADPTLRDRRFDGAPRDWAGHLGRPRLVQLLDRLSPAAPASTAP